MYIFSGEIIQKITHLVQEKYPFWITADWRSSSTPVGSRTLGIVSGASWMVTAQYQRTWAVPGPSEDGKSEVGDNPSNTKYTKIWKFPRITWKSMDIISFHDFSRIHPKSLFSLNNQWLTHRPQAIRGPCHRHCPLILSSDHPWSTRYYSKRPGANRRAWGAPIRGYPKRVLFLY